MQNEILSLDELQDKKMGITGKLKEIQAEISKIGLTQNRINHAPHTINKYTLLKREKLVCEYNELQSEVVNINKQIRKLSERPDFFRNVVKDSFPKDIYEQIIAECDKRSRGMESSKIKGNISEMGKYKEQFVILKQELINQYTALMMARREVTKYIELNCPTDIREKEFFLKNISSVNMSLPTIDYLQKKRRVTGF